MTLKLFTFQHYPSSRLALAGCRTSRVGGTVMGDFYKDDEGGLWRYETQAGYPFGQVRGVTDQYGGKTTSWYDRGMFDDHPAELNSKMDSIATNWTAPSSDTAPADTTPSSDTTPSDATPSDTTPVGPIGTTAPKSKPGTPKTTTKATTPNPMTKPATQVSWFSNPIVIMAVVAIPVALWMWKSA